MSDYQYEAEEEMNTGLNISEICMNGVTQESCFSLVINVGQSGRLGSLEG